MLGLVFFLSGDVYPTDTHVDHKLQARLGGAFRRWIGQKDILHPTTESFALGDFERRADHFEPLTGVCAATLKPAEEVRLQWLVGELILTTELSPCRLLLPKP